METATDISASALQKVVLSVLAAGRTPEVLKITKGTLMWCRQQNPEALEIPGPLRQTLNRPGVAAIGHG